LTSEASVSFVRLTVIGGGGFRVPLIYGALGAAAGQHGPPVDEVVLHDVDARRVAAIERVLAGMAGPRVVVVPDLDAALAGAGYVFCAARVGGLRGRTVDERVALDLGLLGQETVGPGGIAYGLRTVPVMVRIAERIAALAPQAWTIDFTNPVGMVVQAMSAVLGERVIGVCDSPVGLFRRVAWLLGVPLQRVWFDYAGLNHLGWLTAAYTGGRDVLPGLLADPAALMRIEEGRLFGPDRLRALGAIPNEYLHYYYATGQAIAAVREQGSTRGEYLVRQQEEFYATVAGPAGTGPGGAGAQQAVAQQAVAQWARVRAEREATYLPEARRGAPRAAEPGRGGSGGRASGVAVPGVAVPGGGQSSAAERGGAAGGGAPGVGVSGGGQSSAAERCGAAGGGAPGVGIPGDGEPAGGGYEEVALAVMRALAAGPPATLVLNVRNRGALPHLDAGAVVEVPCLVDTNGAHPLAAGPLPGHARELVGAVKAVELATVEAALSGSREAAVRAFALHPLVGSVALARRLVDGYAAGHPELAHLA
jgi:6-phospho-beta-glucosidase